jgi:hypothetical protein
LGPHQRAPHKHGIQAKKKRFPWWSELVTDK